MRNFQDKIRKFDKARGWENNWNIKDLCLNMNEEIGELWNLIKWVEKDKQKDIILQNKEEADNFIGDALFIILKMANQIGTDAESELNKTIDEYEKRMPAEKMLEAGNANKLAGGFDNKNFQKDKDFSDVLIKISNRLNKSEIQWYLIGSMNHKIQGMEKFPNDIDILIKNKDLEKIKDLFKDFDIKDIKEEKEYIKIRFDINGIEVEFCAEFPEGIYQRNFGAEAQNINFESEKICCYPLEKEIKCYESLGRINKAKEIQEFLNK